MTIQSLVSYQPTWQKMATVFQQSLQSQLGSNLINCSHVGSTAMPKIPAQPVIDLALLVKDSVPALTALRAEFVLQSVRTATYRLTWHDQAFNLLLFTDAHAYQTVINFRDYVNAHRTDSRKYTAVRKIALTTDDYYAAKTDFVTSLNGKASDWLATKDAHETHDRTVRAELVNMCLIMNPETHEVIVENKIDAKWTGLTFPGGHVDPGESQIHAMQREVLEETGLTVTNLKLVGTVTWVENDQGDVSLGTLYTTSDYHGELLAGSYEGAISWQPLSVLTPDKLAPGIEPILKVFTNPQLNEAFWGFDDDQLKVY
ncbi:GrpB family protein [Lactiplantibacillus sp. WILCCON 0030]|uniref:GrpB family protein n=1 Tax=Lactiplantibacillus brownii TaxID=3069269 RepID=A0ABU1A8H2_9LACO|nr:GrpB family protein [Lactiplantibacillus brownii]MDQ7936742.1 GrpB family protein [Lactiplantibacillus brownii]